MRTIFDKPRALASILLLAVSFFGAALPSRAANLLVSNFSSSKIAKFDATTGALVNASFIDVGATGRADFALLNDRLYVPIFSAGRIAVYDAHTGALINASFVTGLSSPIAVRFSGGKLYVSNFGTNSIGVYNAATGAAINASLITGLNGPEGFAISNGSVLVANHSTTTVGLYDASTGAAQSASYLTGLDQPQNVAVVGNRIYVLNAGTSTLRVYNSFGVLLDDDFTGPATLNNPGAILFSGNNFYVTNVGTNTVGKFTTSGLTVNASFLSAGMTSPLGVVIVPLPVPTVKIAGGKTVKTGKAVYPLKGSAQGSATVKVKVGKAGPKLAKGGATARWSFKARLKKGKNVITVTAYNADQVASKPAKVTIIRQ